MNFGPGVCTWHSQVVNRFSENESSRYDGHDLNKTSIRFNPVMNTRLLHGTRKISEGTARHMSQHISHQSFSPRCYIHGMMSWSRTFRTFARCGRTVKNALVATLVVTLRLAYNYSCGSFTWVFAADEAGRRCCWQPHMFMLCWCN